MASFGPADDPHLTAPSSSAEELIGAIGLEPRNHDSGRHLEPLQHLARSRIDVPHIALVTFPGAVPELSVDPRHAGNETVGRDRAKDHTGVDPQRPFGPREPGVTTAARSG